jgi:hypothetical protein
MKALIQPAPLGEWVSVVEELVLDREARLPLFMNCRKCEKPEAGFSFSETQMNYVAT